MRLTNKSKLLLNFFTKNKYINHIHQTKKTDNILKELYNEILDAYHFISTIKKNKGDSFYNINIKKITHAYQITKPTKFNANSFPKEIRIHIDESSVSEISYTFSLFNRNIKLFFITEQNNIELNIKTYNNYVDNIIMWLYILNEYSSNQCANNLIVYFYFTSLEKKLPESNIHILDENNVNTAFTHTCPVDSEIVIFRKEEWFKVFIHETFHNFGLDFSDMNNNDCTREILKIFPVNSEVNLYESYTEFWAKIINSLFCSFLILKNKNDIDEFLNNSEFFINFEITYSFFQLVKTLDFMGLTYEDLYSNNEKSKHARETLYKEKTNVLAYYVIKTIMLYNYQPFLSWCKSNNLILLQFKKTIANQKSFCKFIENNYKKKSMLDSVAKTQQFLKILHVKKNDYKTNQSTNFLLSNMRMSMCELG
jgi:hypothetical protein